MQTEQNVIIYVGEREKKTSINEKGGHEFVRVQKGYMRGFEGRKEKGEMIKLYYNLKNK